MSSSFQKRLSRVEGTDGEESGTSQPVPSNLEGKFSSCLPPLSRMNSGRMTEGFGLSRMNSGRMTEGFGISRMNSGGMTEGFGISRANSGGMTEGSGISRMNSGGEGFGLSRMNSGGEGFGISRMNSGGEGFGLSRMNSGGEGFGLSRMNSGGEGFGLSRMNSGGEGFGISRMNSGGEGFGVRTRSWHEEIRSRDLELDKEEGGGEVQLTAAAPESQEAADDSDFQSPPTTPKSTTSSPFLECPSTPLLKRKQLSRQQSLRDTKLLLTTHLKRTASIFMFDKHFEYLREIGHGSFSTVYEARDRKGGALCAVKMSKREFFSRVDRDRYMREIQSVACLAEHPNVVNYFRGWQQDSHFYIQMELCEAGNLRTLLDSLKQPLDEHQVWEYIEDVASGLSHIHKHGVLHLDIKPDNIFIDGQGNLKIGDFGLAVPCKLWDWEEGDGGYLAPELLQEEDPSPKADIYSFGAMAYEWVTGAQLPRTRPAGEDIPRMPSWRSEALRSLVRAMLHPDPVKRPSADQILSYQKSRP